jgi:ABC-2 type transport system permease protein
MSDAGNFLRVFFGGGLYAFRALFGWIEPVVFVPMLLVSPLFQLLFFAYLGRATHTRDDTFFVVGNAIEITALGSLFGIGFTMDGERYSQTLPALIASPANRVALFVGRGIPVIVNAVVVSIWAFAAGWLLLDVHLAASGLLPLVVVLFVGAFSATACGFVLGSLSLRYRNVVITANIVAAAMLIFCGVNIPRESLPHWMRLIGDGLPLTRAIAAGRELAAGASLGSVSHLLLAELIVGLLYGLAGYALLRWFELQGRKHAALELS